ncbi:hypothetical protein HPB47_010842 [Ixodes persulcatus]|uniref:Uncharacterized protein n=1 Tax=Ixodes persulcatus TaxID=34615 RepID=A0AC60NY82_IXOPE|nr:hypothetical protein HPB47_010842 [Ixodes persulcatus]
MQENPSRRAMTTSSMAAAILPECARLRTTFATSTGEPSSLDVSAIRKPRLRKFWAPDPQLWFAQVESQFTRTHITSQTWRFHHGVAALPHELATDIRNLILQPQTTNPYDTLKQELIKCTSPSKHRRLQRLLRSKELGDRTTSKLLRRLQKFRGEQANGSRRCFGLALVQLAQLADTAMKVATAQVAPVKLAQTHRHGTSEDFYATEAQKILFEGHQAGDHTSSTSTTIDVPHPVWFAMPSRQSRITTLRYLRVPSNLQRLKLRRAELSYGKLQDLPQEAASGGGRWLGQTCT